MTPDDKINELITSVGSMAEMLGLFRKELMKNGFDSDEALELCHTFLQTSLANDAGGV